MPLVLRLLLVLAVAVPVLAPMIAVANQSQFDVTGEYKSNWDDVTLRQNGDRIHGTYVCCGGGTIEGRIIEGRVIKYSWTQPGGSGRGVWTIEHGRLEGTWGVGQSESDGGRWDLARTNSNTAIAN